MVEMTAPTPKDAICDPACGTAGFLIAASAYLVGHHSDAIYCDEAARHRSNEGTFHGYDFDSTMLRIGSMNMLLDGMEKPDIRYRDSLVKPAKDNTELGMHIEKEKKRLTAEIFRVPGSGFRVPCTVFTKKGNECVFFKKVVEFCSERAFRQCRLPYFFTYLSIRNLVFGTIGLLLISFQFLEKLFQKMSSAKSYPDIFQKMLKKLTTYRAKTVA